MGGSTEGPIYSTIDATNEELNGFAYAQHASTAPYASTSIMPFTNQTQAPAHSGEQQQEDGHWIGPPGLSGSQYAQPDRSNGEECTQGPDAVFSGSPAFTSQQALLVFKRNALGFICAISF